MRERPFTRSPSLGYCTMDAAAFIDKPVRARCPVAPTERLGQNGPDVRLAALVDRPLIVESPLVLLPREVLGQYRAAKDQPVDVEVKVPLEDLADDIRPEAVSDDRQFGLGVRLSRPLKGHSDLRVDMLD